MQAPPPRWQRVLYVAVAAVLLLPIWSARFMPTGDGPCHVYNAWVLLHLDDPAYPRFGETFTVRVGPMPNWLIQVLLVGLLHVASPLVAEKLLLSLYVATFAAAAWYFAGAVERGRAAAAFLLLPLAWHQLVYWGFYNFAFGVPILLAALGYWWRHRAAPTPRFALALSLLLLLGWFAHVVTTVLALAGIAILWLASAKRVPARRHVLHLAILAPQAILPLWFLIGRHGIEPVTGTIPLDSRLGFLARLGAAFPHQSPLAGQALALLFAALLVATLVRLRRHGEGAQPVPLPVAERHAFLLLALAYAVVFLIAPDAMAGGSILLLRLSLFPFLALVPWLAPPRPRVVFAGVAVALAATATWQAVRLAEVHRELDPQLAAFGDGLAAAAPHSRVLPIVYGREEGLAGRVFGHAAGWAAIDRGLVDWSDYQAASELFPIGFRDIPGRPDNFAVEAHPERYAVRRHLAVVDYVYTWRMPVDAPLRRRLERFYDAVATSGEGVLYRRHLPKPAAEGR